MKHLWEQKWFCTTVTYLNAHWDWWNRNIYGKSKNMEDFVRNPAEVLRDNCFPFCIKNITPISLINARFIYRHFELPSPESQIKQDEYVDTVKKETGVDINPQTFWLVPMGKHKLGVQDKTWTFFDIRVWNPFWTKFCNALLFFQLVISLKYYIIPIPYIAFCLRFTKTSYFQFGLGWGPQRQEVETDKYNTVLTGKFLIAAFKSEQQWNPSDVYGFYEGTI